MFIKRSQKLPKKYSILLFGARGVGKSLLLEQPYDLHKNLYINLLSIEEERFARNPNELIALVERSMRSHLPISRSAQETYQWHYCLSLAERY